MTSRTLLGFCGRKLPQVAVADAQCDSDQWRTVKDVAFFLLFRMLLSTVTFFIYALFFFFLSARQPPSPTGPLLV